MKKLWIIGLSFISLNAFGSGIYNPGSGGGGGGGGTSGQVNSANQYSAPYYSVSGSSNVLSGLAPGTSGYVFTTRGAGLAPYWNGDILSASSATATYLQLSSATATYLKSSSATVTYAPISGSANYIQNDPGSVQVATITTRGPIATQSYFTLNANPTIWDGASIGGTTLIVGNSGMNFATQFPGLTTCVGGAACTALTNGAVRNTLVGYSAGHAITTGDDNTCIGSAACQLMSTQSQNACYGSSACNSLSTGSGQNTAIGYLAMPNATTAANNTCIGADCLDLLQTGTNNVAVGPTAGGDITTGSRNICIGGNTSQNGQACTGIVAGSSNTMVGAGATGAVGSTNGNNTGNTFLGYNAGSGSANTPIAGSICIGYNCAVTSSYTAQIGGSGADAVRVTGSTFTFSSGTVTSQFTAGTYQGGSLTTCGDSTHGLGWSGGSFTCQSITGSGGGGGSSTLAIATGTVVGFSGTISSPTAVLNFDSSQFVGSLTGSATAYMAINTSSITALGSDIDLNSAEITGTLQVGHGGTGFTSATENGVLIGVGSSYSSLIIPDCSGTGKALTYSPTSGTFQFGCNSNFVSATSTNVWSGGNTYQSSSTFNGAVRFSSGVVVSTVGVTGNYTATSTDTVIMANCSSACTVTLPTASGIGGRSYTVKMLNAASAGNVTVGTTSSQTIDGVTTQVLFMQYTSITVISDGSNWSIL